MQQQPDFDTQRQSLLEKENEYLTTEKVALQDSNDNLISKNETLTAQNQKQSESIGSLQQKLEAEQKAREVEASELQEVKSKVFSYKQTAHENETLAEVGKQATKDKRAEYVEKYLSYHDRDDSPLTQKEKLHIKEYANDRTYSEIVDDLIELSQNALKRGLFRGADQKRSAGQPDGYTRASV